MSSDFRYCHQIQIPESKVIVKICGMRKREQVFSFFKMARAGFRKELDWAFIKKGLYQILETKKNLHGIKKRFLKIVCI